MLGELVLIVMESIISDSRVVESDEFFKSNNQFAEFYFKENFSLQEHIMNKYFQQNKNFIESHARIGSCMYDLEFLTRCKQ